MTIVATMTLRQVVSRVPGALRVFHRLGIEAEPRRTLGESCVLVGVQVDEVLETLRLLMDRTHPVTLMGRSIAALVHSHQSLDTALGEVIGAAHRLRSERHSDLAAEHCIAAWEFVFGYALPHMVQEDNHHLLTLANAGAPLEALYLLGEDHAVLRQLARRLAGAGLTEGARTLSDEAVDCLMQFVETFQWHVEREEKVLAQLAGRLAR